MLKGGVLKWIGNKVRSVTDHVVKGGNGNVSRLCMV
jgi:hypothetical protein